MRDRNGFFSALALSLGFLGLWAFYVRNAAPSVTVGDSGELIAAAATLSLPHAPSYPLFALLGRLFQEATPWADAGLRLNFFSAFLGLACLSLVYALARGLGMSRPAAFFGAALLAGAPALFHNSLVTEVFTLNAALALALLLAGLSGGPRALCLAGFLAGLGLGNHHTLVLMFPGGLLLWRRSTGRGLPPARVLFFALLFFVAGLSVYGFLPLRSRQEPPLDWGNPETVSGLTRTFLRKDYGSFSLSLGEQPPRTFSNTARQVRRYVAGHLHQVTWPGALLLLGGLALFWRQDRRLAAGFVLLWFFSGPFFLWLGNMPFDAQSDGVLERFLILPVVLTAALCARAWDGARDRAGAWAFVLFALPLFLLARAGRAFPLRQDFLAADYSRGVLRTLPPRAALFMDGGDDTFYTLAFQRYVRRQREDLALFDRGGLIFRGPYGADFRSLNKQAKEERRQRVERAWLGQGPLFYSTMNDKILLGEVLSQRGFLYQAGARAGSFLWDMYAFRALYPVASRDYRTRALAPYFPLMRARALWQDGRRGAALVFLKRARAFGADVPWLRSNLVQQCLEWGFERLQAGDWGLADALYKECLSLAPERPDVMSNLGVLWERRGDMDQAVSWYERALRVDPGHVNSLYNLAVVRWRRGEWAQVVPLLERVLRADPAHEGARRYLPVAKQRWMEAAR